MLYPLAKIVTIDRNPRRIDCTEGPVDVSILTLSYMYTFAALC